MGRGASNTQVAHTGLRPAAPALDARAAYHVRPTDQQPIVSRVALADGRELSVRCWPGEGEPLVLLHGLLDEASGWDDLARSTNRPVIAVDLPGFGASSQPTRPRMCAYAADVADALERLHVQRFGLVGHSFGGGVAAHVAAKLDERVSDLVLMAPAGFGPNAAAQTASARGVRHLVGAGLPLMLANPLVVAGAYAATVSHRRMPSRALVDRMRAQARRVGRGAQAAVQAIAAASQEDCLYRTPSSYRGPVRALWGARDLLVPGQHAQGVLAAFPAAQVTVWDGMGHHPQHERPAELAAYLNQQAACAASAPAGAAGRRSVGRAPTPIQRARQRARAARQAA